MANNNEVIPGTPIPVTPTPGALPLGGLTPENDASSMYEQAVSDRIVADEEMAWQTLLDQGLQENQESSAGAQTLDNSFAESPRGSAVGASQAREELGANLRSAFTDVKSGAATVAKNVVEVPKEIVAGVVDAFGEAEQAIAEITGLGTIQIRTGKEAESGGIEVEYFSYDEMREANIELLFEKLALDPADTATGAIVRGIAQFVTGFIPALKGVKALGVTGAVTSAMTAGALADLVVFDPHEDRLSTMLNEVPALEPFVSDYLADSDPENETALEGRLKNAIEGAGLGITADGVVALMRGLKYYKAQRVAVKNLAPDTKAARGAKASSALDDASRTPLVEDVTDEALRPLGSADEPFMRVSPQTRVQSSFKSEDVDIQNYLDDLATQSDALERLDAIGKIGSTGDNPRIKNPITAMANELRSVGPDGDIPDHLTEFAQSLKELGIDVFTSKNPAIHKTIAKRRAIARKFKARTETERRLAEDGARAAGRGNINSLPLAPKEHGFDDYFPNATPENPVRLAFNSDHFTKLGLSDDDIARIAESQKQFLAETRGSDYVPFGEAEDFDEVMAEILKDFDIPAGDVVDLSAARLNKMREDVFGSLEELAFRQGRLEGISRSLSGDASSLSARDEKISEALLMDGNHVIVMSSEPKARGGAAAGSAVDEDFDAIGDWAIIQDIINKTDAKFKTSTISGESDAGTRVATAVEEANQAGAFPRKPISGEVMFNHARVNAPDDVHAALQEALDSDAAAIDAKRRGVVPNTQTIKESSQEYRELDDLIGRPPGPMNAAQAVAARKVLAASGGQIVDLAKKASMPGATSADVYNFRRAMSVHYAIQSEVIAARTETARALQSWAIPVGASPTRSNAIDELIKQSGGMGDVQALAKAVASAGDNPAALNDMARQLGKGKFGKALYQVWINGLLSSPKTHMVNMLSNSMVALYSIPERYMAAGISTTFQKGEITSGEAAANMFAIVKGAREGISLVWHGNNAANVGDLGDAFDAFSKIEVNSQDISATAFGLPPEGMLGKGADILGKAVNVPGALLRTEDKFFKAAGYRMELNSLAYRSAANEGLEGEAAAKRMADILRDPPDHIKAEAIDVAHYRTFTNKLGPIGNSITKMANTIPLARLVVPFLRTPINIVKYTFARTPLAYMSGGIRADIKAGGPRAAQAHARVALGSMVMMTMSDMTLEGTITGRGPTDTSLRNVKLTTGWQPYSIKVNDRWYQYSRTDPIGMMMGFGSDLTEILAGTHGEETENLATAVVLSMANNLANKTYMSGIYDFIAAADPSNPTSDPGKYLTNFVGSMVPYSSFLRSTANANDPVIRETRGATYGEDGELDATATYIEELMANVRKGIPGANADAPPRRDIFGEPLDRASGLGWAYDFISPLNSKMSKDDPTAEVILDNQIRISNVPRQIMGVRLSAEQYSEFQRLAGQPLKEELDDLVQTDTFKSLSGGPDGMKAMIVKQLVRNFRAEAKARLINSDPDLERLIVAAKNRRAGSLGGDEEFQ